jgi:UDP-N-acetylglucosamine/UDP-N-acetylgalactosamine diphosphorylase
MFAVPDNIRRHLERHDQEQVLRWWDQLSDAQRHELLAQLRALDLKLLQQLYEQRETVYHLPDPKTIQPVPVIPADAPTNPQAKERGEASLRSDHVAVLVVAGGQGSRLGFDHPKGMFSIGPVSGKSLFQLHAEKVLAVQRRYGSTVPFLIMISPATHDETIRYFEQHRFFGLSPDEVWLFEQGTMPALDLATGKLLLDSKSRLFLSPDGHGGTLTALADSGLLARIKKRGIRHVFYFQVDNPLVKVADPTFLGHHLQARAEVSSRIIPKNGPHDKLGNFVQVNGRCMIIEYSDLPDDLARQKDADGRLRLWAGSPAIHYFDVDFLAKVTQGSNRIPFHIAKKKVPYLDETGTLVHPEKENALKFERFIFDVLPLADRWTVVETSREEEFAPLKNATGADSPEAVKNAITHLAADWLTRCGTAVPRDAAGESRYPLEISPLFALDAEVLCEHLKTPPTITCPTLLE